jgi:hypothetical protein
MQEQMHMRIDEPGEQRGIAEVNDASRWRMVDGRSDRFDSFSFDQNFAGSENLSGCDVKQARRVKDDGRRGRLLGLGRAAQQARGARQQHRQAKALR